MCTATVTKTHNVQLIFSLTFCAFLSQSNSSRPKRHSQCRCSVPPFSKVPYSSFFSYSVACSGRYFCNKTNLFHQPLLNEIITICNQSGRLTDLRNTAQIILVYMHRKKHCLWHLSPLQSICHFENKVSTRFLLFMLKFRPQILFPFTKQGCKQRSNSYPNFASQKGSTVHLLSFL